MIESCCVDTSVINPPSSANDVPVYLSTTEFVFSSTESAVLGAESCDYFLICDNTGSFQQCIRGLDNDGKSLSDQLHQHCRTSRRDFMNLTAVSLVGGAWITTTRLA